MSHPDHGELQAIWQNMARRNAWSLVDDEAAFLAAAAAERGALRADTLARDHNRIAVWRAYSVLLYSALQRREERAAAELWSMSVRMAIKDGRTRAEAEELAQEAIARTLEKLAGIRSPQGTLTYAIMIIRTLLRERPNSTQHEQPIETENDDERDHEPADPSNIAEEVEAHLANRALAALLRAKLTNELEYITVLRIALLGEQPRDVARDLGLPLHRTRVAKSRALARLREDSEFMALFGTADLETAQAGADDDDA